MTVLTYQDLISADPQWAAGYRAALRDVDPQEKIKNLERLLARPLSAFIARKENYERGMIPGHPDYVPYRMPPEEAQRLIEGTIGKYGFAELLRILAS